ncbi:MAG: SMI1/KNR4 family protein, partial [Planctomycetia bacterium]|nr:SMI1/KNR4 family protein [Planctomycetia bacterium]
MIDFDRFWNEGNSPYPDDEAGPDEVPPCATDDEILAWEREHGVTLPEPLRTALGRRNGGYVRNAPVEVLPIEQIVPVDDDFWEWTEIAEDEAPDHD